VDSLKRLIKGDQGNNLNKKTATVTREVVARRRAVSLTT